MVHNPSKGDNLIIFAKNSWHDKIQIIQICEDIPEG